MSIGGHHKPNRGKTDRWLTPIEIVQALGHFDLDPCGERSHPTASTIYEDDGLRRGWFGRVWLNPPYSEVGKWMYRLAEHGSGIALVFARTETRWAQKVLPKASSVLFLAGRLTFTSPVIPTSGNSGAPSMLLAFGEKPKWPFKGWIVEA